MMYYKNICVVSHISINRLLKKIIEFANFLDNLQKYIYIKNGNNSLDLYMLENEANF